jgi:hypothetical protein
VRRLRRRERRLRAVETDLAEVTVATAAALVAHHERLARHADRITVLEDRAAGLEAAAPAPAPAAEPEPDAPEATEPAADRGLTDKQQLLVDAVGRLGEASTAEVSAAVGRPGEGAAVTHALRQLRDRGLVGHNGQRARAARWLAVAPAAARPGELTDLEQRIVALVTEHGPVTSVWVADQLVKNRRDTAAAIRDLQRRGVLAGDGAAVTAVLEQAA